MIKRIATAAALAIISGVFLPFGNNTSAAQRTTHSPVNIQRIVDERSPGERAAGALLQTKPEFRVLPAYIAHGGQDEPAPDFLEPIPPPLPFMIAGDYIPTSPLVLPEADVPPIGDTFVWDVPGYGIDHRPPGYAVPPGQAVPVSPVPEPSTWAMMILGIGFLGAMFRRERREGVRELKPEGRFI